MASQFLTKMIYTGYAKRKWNILTSGNYLHNISEALKSKPEEPLAPGGCTAGNRGAGLFEHCD
jgi:hypothetical protein